MKDSLEEIISKVENDLPLSKKGIFAGNLDPEEAQIILIPVPWEATTSYGTGTAKAPKSIARESHQLDLYDPVFGKTYQKGIALLESDEEIEELNQKMFKKAKKLRKLALTDGAAEGPIKTLLEEINAASTRVNEIVYERAIHHLTRNKIVGLVGGEHSVTLGLVKALSEISADEFSILHLDAHLDLRNAYEGMKHSHASAMFNVLEAVPSVKKIVSVGVRDFSEQEMKLAMSSDKIKVFFDHEISQKKIEGTPFSKICTEIVKGLSDNVYISFDIDGLEPALCPNTGTPVPGGLSFNEAAHLLETLIKYGKKVVGFDLCEVVSSKGKNTRFDANVGARILYKLCGCCQ